ncbi:MAG: hypothetical protein Q9184_001763 [Pyrenodesmia sp. 2 TL-2023]
MTNAFSDSVYSDPQPSVSSSLSLISEDCSKKRKRRSDQDGDIRTWRPKRHYSTKYHSLLNDAIEDLPLDPLWLGRSDLYPGQVGISRWSPIEKEFLFRGLVRYGRDNLPGITTLIGTKSEVEVHVYLQLLQEADAKLHKYGNRQLSIGAFDIPAAAEVSEHCCAALGQAADSLASMQLRFEECQERRAHFGLWKLDQNAAEWVNQRTFEGEASAAEINQKLPAARILNLSSFLELSAGLFMNSNEPANNYRSFVSGSEKPSIFYTAFSDLYSVTLSIIKRIVQSSLFFAMSRLRAAYSSSYSHKRTVKRADVLAALKVLGMMRNAANFWAELPRRCKLDVYTHADMKGRGGAMCYDEVEEMLRRTISTDATLARRSPTVDSDAESAEASMSGGDSSSATSSSPERIGGSKPHATQSSGTSESPLPAGDFCESTEEYLEYVDQEASTQEEIKLWEMLGKEPPTELVFNDSTARPKSPGHYRKNEDDLDDWRGWANFKPAWEIYDLESLNDDFVENRRQTQSPSMELARPKDRLYAAGKKSNGATCRDLWPIENTWVDELSRADGDESIKNDASVEYESYPLEEESEASSDLQSSDTHQSSHPNHQYVVHSTSQPIDRLDIHDTSSSGQEYSYREADLGHKPSLYERNMEDEPDVDDATSHQEDDDDDIPVSPESQHPQEHEPVTQPTLVDHEDNPQTSEEPIGLLQHEVPSSGDDRMS